jgi:predicted ATP-grasp superfamily ATP-dependent carboligase
MRLFLYESLSAGGLGDDPPASLQAEGWAMLSAVAADFVRVADVVTLLGPNRPNLPDVDCRRTTSADEAELFQDTVDACDAALLIAPEFDDILAQRAARVLGRGKRLLGCRPDAIQRTADKLALAEYWTKRGVPTPPTRLAAGQPPATVPAVIKPRDGAGSQATRLIVDAATWEENEPVVRRELPGRDFLLQPFHPGRAASVAFLIGPRQTLPLAPTEQIQSTDGSFQYRGGRLPLAEDEANRAVSLARRALDGIDGLAGFVGVDLVLGLNGDDVAMEINPRLTTSYIGLRALCRDNLAKPWLRILDGASDVTLAWSPGPIIFAADGRAK